MVWDSKSLQYQGIRAYYLGPFLDAHCHSQHSHHSLLIEDPISGNNSVNACNAARKYAITPNLRRTAPLVLLSENIYLPIPSIYPIASFNEGHAVFPNDDVK